MEYFYRTICEIYKLYLYFKGYRVGVNVFYNSSHNVWEREQGKIYEVCKMINTDGVIYWGVYLRVKLKDGRIKNIDVQDIKFDFL
jgi:threonyl-tRNA synthetase